MSSIINLSPQLYDLLAQRARQVHETPDTFAESLIRRSLSTEDQQWRQAFDALIRRVQARTRQFSSEEIEADITTAATEVKESRRAHRSRH